MGKVWISDWAVKSMAVSAFEVKARIEVSTRDTRAVKKRRGDGYQDKGQRLLLGRNNGETNEAKSISTSELCGNE